MEKMELMEELQVHYKDFVKRMKGRVSYDDYETQSLLEGYTEELASFIFKELDKAREEGRREALETLHLKLNDCIVYINDNGDIDHGVIGAVNRSIVEELSKLKTKEDGK